MHSTGAHNESTVPTVACDGGEEVEQRGVWEELAVAFRLAFSAPALSLMMFLQYAIWGAWEPALSGYLEKHLGFSGIGMGLIYSALPLMNLLAPFSAGQVADRWLPTQIALGIFHLLGGAFMILMAFQNTLPPMLVFMLIYSLLFAPTLALTNSLALHHLKDPQREFGPIRVWGTIGWIAAGLILTGARKWFGTEELRFHGLRVIDAFLLAGGFSVLMGIISFALPHTPPAKEAPDPLAFREAFVLLRNRSYLVFFIIAFVVATELRLYYVLTFPFLQQAGEVVGITSETLPAWMVIAQVAEIFVMTFLLPYALPRWGVRTCLLIGILAWPVRYFVFALVWSVYQTIPFMVWLAIASLALHGFCYVFFFVVAFIYTDMVAPPDIRASGQALINFAVLGLGLLIGGLFAGWLKDLFTVGDVTNYTHVFLVPAIITVLCAIIFAALFRDTGTVEQQGA